MRLKNHKPFIKVSLLFDKIPGPVFQFFYNLMLFTSQHGVDCEEVFLQTVDQRNWEFIVHNLFLSNNYQPVTNTYKPNWNEGYDTVKLFNFASDLFSRYSRGRYYRENKLQWKFNTSILANGTS